MDSPCSSISTPGSNALMVAKNTRDLEIFKKPTGTAVRSKNFKRKILDEDTYLDKIGEIIERDFFPHLEKLKAQNEYLDALEQNNITKMRELYEKYSSGCPISERIPSPATFETPLREEQINESVRSQRSTTSSSSTSSSSKGGKMKKKTSLDTYLSTHTSEDNASFEELIEEAEQKQRLKYSWLYEAEEKSKIKEIESNKIQNAIESKPFEVDSWKYKNKNYIMYVPDGVELTSDEKIEMAKRKQEVQHENTRLKINPFNDKQNKETISELAKTQSKTNDGKIGIDGKEIIKNQTPNINGFSFVTTPSPRPGECESPIMTWGQIEGTPFRLDGGDTPIIRSHQGPSFRMAEPPKREKIALRLAEKANERHRDRKNKALEVARKSFATPSPRSQSKIDRLATMSPAARRLATQKLKIIATPSPRRSLSRTPIIGIKTPNIISRHSDSTSGDEKESQEIVLTDNLLNLPSRNRAADFFV
ncbi:hypothetical protein HCN44_004219 [Aphidius gifuensis]|uniref:Uncharacterized protein n=1 Tax=Aphidius gifuensis TaxID=684658 RepID=A0A834Y050_APHGI|nr:splicing factor ESS-2 homolog [Aphidius gifuensis]KAF7994747.1 hypothetical protein HCN44_004219 [Aphidius gifuensis]